MKNLQTKENQTELAKEELNKAYLNKMQALVRLVNAQHTFVEAGRGTGKTEGIITYRTIDVARGMPQSTFLFAGATYVGLMKNIIPNLLATYRVSQANGKPLMTEGYDFVVGKRDLPKHFAQPLRPIQFPEHTIVYKEGSYAQLVSTDRADSAAGVNASHLFVEEMKHHNGKKLKGRVIPTLRGRRDLFGNCHLFQGITGVSDAPNLELGEDSWFTEFEELNIPEVIESIANVSEHYNKLLREKYLQGKDVERKIKRWGKLLNEIRTGATHYVRASSFTNKDILGLEYFRTAYKNMTEEEFLLFIGNVRLDQVKEMFFKYFGKQHTFEDSYKYDYIDKYKLSDTIKITCKDLKHYDRRQPLLIGFDPGNFASCVVAQEKKRPFQLRVLKNFWKYPHLEEDDIPVDLDGMARKIAEFFPQGERRSSYIKLYYDRAGNQEQKEEALTAAKEFRACLQKHGFVVELKNLGQRTIFLWEHYKLLEILLKKIYKRAPEILICLNECAELISAIKLSPMKRNHKGMIGLDKSSELKLDYKFQAEKSTQLPTALMYLIFSLFVRFLPANKRNTTSVPGM